jgi:iron complex outermembrane receptor protein
MKSTSHLALVIAFLLGALAFLLAETVWAQTENSSRGETLQLDQIMVTADKREQNIQDVPTSITNISEEQLKDAKADDLVDVMAMTPNISVTKVGAKGNSISFTSIRGITSSMGLGSVLGVYVDDVYYPYFDMSILDAERVELLRGPQGTLYGRNAEAGIINIITKGVSDFWTGKISTSYGSFNYKDATLSGSGPIIDNVLGIRASFRYEGGDNYFYNQFDNDDNVNRFNNFDGRIKISGTPSENFNYDYTFDIQNYDYDGYADFAPLNIKNPRKNINVDYPGYSRAKTYVNSFRARYDADNLSFLSVTSFLKNNSDTVNDVDFLPMDLINLKIKFDTANLSQEFRLFSNDDSSQFKWLVGFHGFIEKYKANSGTTMNLNNMMFPGMGIHTIYNTSQINTKGIAIFGQASYIFLDDFELTMGLRYNHLSRKIDYSQEFGPILAGFGFGNDIQGTDQKTFRAWLPKVALSYKPTENIKTYVSLSRGFREGSFNFSDFIGSPYKSEFTWNYEFGAKTQWLDNNLTINMALFLIDWTDRQVEILGPGGTAFRIENAGSATSKGFELEAMYRVTPDLNFRASFGYTHAKYDEYRPSPITNYSGKWAVDSPRYTARLEGTYRFLEHMLVTAAYTRHGKTYYDPDNTIYQSGFNLIDLKVGYESENFEVYLWGKNLLNEDYVTRVVRAAGSGDLYGRPGEPFSIGINVGFSF